MAGKTILLKGSNHFDEGTLEAAVSPGMAVELTPTGGLDEVQASQAEALKQGIPIVVLEDALQGKIVTAAYSSGDKVFTYQPVAGDHIQVLVKDGETIAVADKLVLEGGGSGLWLGITGSEAAYQVKALEAVSPSGANGLCSVAVL
tara:strand:- start:22620 stop:23057 length:438 start_codon:yes stop_codon:yes gene_type:complete